MVESDPYGRDEFAAVADEPGVSIVAGGPCLSRYVAQTIAFEPRGRAVLHHTAQERVHHKSGRGIDHVSSLGLVLIQQTSAAIFDAAEQVGAGSHTEVREDGVSRRQLA